MWVFATAMARKTLTAAGPADSEIELGRAWQPYTRKHYSDSPYRRISAQTRWAAPRWLFARWLFARWLYARRLYARRATAV